MSTHIGDATTTTWAPKKEVFADLKHIARSAQCHALLSMTKTTLPMIIQKASAQGTVLSVKEKIRSGKPVFEVMVVQGSTIKPTFYDLVTGQPTASFEQREVVGLSSWGRHRPGRKSPRPAA